MGVFLKGRWLKDKYEMDLTVEGHQMDKVRHWITPDGSPGPTGDGGFAAEGNRYHLYVSKACPFAQSTLIMHALKSLEGIVSVSEVETVRDETEGWQFSCDDEAYRDPVNNAAYLRELYLINNPEHTGRVVVPLLWDKQNHQIVSTESLDIMRMFNSAFNALTDNQTDLYPADLCENIDSLNSHIEQAINFGVYGVGFSFDQATYEIRCRDLFDALEAMDERLSTTPFLFGSKMTLPDIRLMITLLRFDAVYHYHFKCNLKRIEDFQHLKRFVEDMYKLDAIRNTTDIRVIKKHYYLTHKMLNPTGIIPLGPEPWL